MNKAPKKVYTLQLFHMELKILLEIYRTLFALYLLKKVGQICHNLIVADCKPVVFFNTFLCPCVSEKWVVGSTILLSCRFNLLAQFLRSHCIPSCGGSQGWLPPFVLLLITLITFIHSQGCQAKAAAAAKLGSRADFPEEGQYVTKPRGTSSKYWAGEGQRSDYDSNSATSNSEFQHAKESNFSTFLDCNTPASISRFEHFNDISSLLGFP